MARKIDVESERIYENRKVAGEDIRAKQSKYYWATALIINRFNSKTYKTISGKDVLEIGCSDGKMAASYAPYCNTYVGVDISDVGIETAGSVQVSQHAFLTLAVI